MGDRRKLLDRARQGRFVLVVVSVLLAGAFGVERALNADRVLRGVSVWNVSLSGLSRAEATRALGDVAERAREEERAVLVERTVYPISLADLGGRVDLGATVDRAMEVGRTGGVVAQLGWWLSSFVRPAPVGLVVRADEAALLRAIDEWESEAIVGAPFAGSVTFRDGRVVPDYPRVGRRIDRPAAVADVVDGFAFGVRRAVTLKLVEREPPVDGSEIDRAVEEATKLIARTITLENPDEGVQLEFAREQLGAVLAVRVTSAPGARAEVHFDAEKIDARVASIRSRLEEPPEDARFDIDARDRVTLVPGRAGTLVDASRVAESLLATARAGRREGPLPIERSAQPKFTTADAERLGIKELVSKFTTYHHCCEDRVKNIHRIADLLDRTIVEAGATFSVNATIGPRTGANGFIMAPSIADGEMVKTPGGGISQFATTMFNAVFYGGYDVVERQPHSYYFARYPVGHEATLSFPKPDLIFRNDSDAAILIRTFYGPTNITVKLFGDNGGRKIRRIVSRQFDVTQPPIEYEADDALSPHDEKVKYSGQSGFTVVVSRVVTFADGKKKEEKRKVVYQPRPRIVRVHSCRIPEGEEGHTGDPCPESETDAGTIPDAGSFDPDAGT